jgi:hypothetical protein
MLPLLVLGGAMVATRLGGGAKTRYAALGVSQKAHDRRQAKKARFDAENQERIERGEAPMQMRENWFKNELFPEEFKDKNRPLEDTWLGRQRLKAKAKEDAKRAVFEAENAERVAVGHEPMVAGLNKYGIMAYPKGFDKWYKKYQKEEKKSRKRAERLANPTNAELRKGFKEYENLDPRLAAMLYYRKRNKKRLPGLDEVYDYIPAK